MRSHLTAREADQTALRQVIWWSFVIALVTFLPFLLLDGGRFTLIADFNQQQIPFNLHSAWTIRERAVGWDWYTDLGVNFIGAFSFYTLGSPFFWLTLLFPEGAFPYLVGWLYLLKYVAAAVFAFLWLKRHVKDPVFAVAGALLYAFSGFSHINLMYYHFHEVIAFFPLLLYAMDRLVLEKKRGWFALTAALCALTNYFFFFGEAIFLILYFFLFYRFASKKDGATAFFAVLFEGILGALASAVLLLPSALFIISSPKAASMISPEDALRYPLARYLALIKALLFPAESMIRQSAVLPYDFSSSALYLPGIGLSLVPAAWISRKNRRFLIVLTLFALVPWLNSSFALFNSFYYARWFFMPVLMLGAFSVQALEEVDPRQCQRSVLAVAGSVLAFILLFLAFDAEVPSLILDQPMFVFSSLVALIGLIATHLILGRSGKKKMEHLIRLIALFSCITGIYSLGLIRGFHPMETYEYSKGYFEETARFDLTPPEGENTQNYRFYVFNPGWNLSMLNHAPSVNAFITTNSPSTAGFFDVVGIRHIAATQFPADPEDILTFLSVRYRIDSTQQAGGRQLYQKHNGAKTLYVSENPDFIPLGYPLDYFISKEDLMTLPQAQRARVLLDSVVVSQGEGIPSHLTPYTDRDPHLPASDIARAKRQRAVRNFERSHRGFSGDVLSPHTQTILFTVPWDSGWAAEVDGMTVEIGQSLGFMTVEVPEGLSQIRFTYEIPGLRWGMVLTGAGFVLIFGLILLDHRKQASRSFLKQKLP